MMRLPSFKSLFVVLALAAGLAGAAQAQSTTGNISGSALAGETVVINSPDIGFHRELEIKKDGKFSVRHVPAGSYTVVRLKPDGTVSASQSVVVQAGATARVM
jgi:hypothetical protein